MMITYRPLAFRRDYESICLPLPNARSPIRQAEYLKAHRDEVADGVPMVCRQSGGDVEVVTVVGRPDPIGDAVTRNGLLYADRPAGLNDLRALAKQPALSQFEKMLDRVEARRARTTTEIPIAVDATLPAIAAALVRLRASLGRNGTAAQIMAVEAITRAVDGCTPSPATNAARSRDHGVGRLRRERGRMIVYVITHDTSSCCGTASTVLAVASNEDTAEKLALMFAAERWNVGQLLRDRCDPLTCGSESIEIEAFEIKDP